MSRHNLASRVHNGADIIDSRDVIARIDELESEDAQDMDDDMTEELRVLKALQEEADGCADWQHGEALVRDSYFQKYAEDLADDTGLIDKNAGWPANCIDWEEAAEMLQSDYTSVDFDGVTYWIRS